MITTILTHAVKDFTEWKKGFDDNAEQRSQAGLQITGLYQAVDNPNMVTLIGEAPSVEALNNFISNPELQAAMVQGGVIGMPEVKILNKL